LARSSTFDPQPLGTLLRRFRLAAGLTQEGLAEEAGISRISISALERGVRRLPHVDTVTRLADALHLTTEDTGRLRAAARLNFAATAGAGRNMDARTRGPDATIVGRVREREAIARLLKPGSHPLILIGGGRGFGKTALLDDSAQYARRHGWRVLHASCDPSGGSGSLSPFAEALSDHLSTLTHEQREAALRANPWLIRIVPEYDKDLDEPLLAVSPDDERRLIVSDLASYLASSEPDARTAMGTLLVLDDLHCASARALALWVALIRNTSRRLDGHMPVRYLAAYTAPPGPPAHALLDLVIAGYAAHIELEPMSAQHAGDLVQRFLPDASELAAAQIVADAGGIPSLLVALAGEASADGLHSPSAVAFIIRASVASLSPLARALLSIAARQDAAVTRNDLPRPTAGREPYLHRALDELCEAGLVVTSGDGRYHIAAPAIRAAVITLLPDP
jgi:transcriptional regulator with XRE-family HTH domain